MIIFVLSNSNVFLKNIYCGIALIPCLLCISAFIYTGVMPVRGKNVTVHCTGYGKDGDMNAVFWSTKDAGQEPFTFRIGLNQVIKGWDEGVMTMVIPFLLLIKYSILI